MTPIEKFIDALKQNVGPKPVPAIVQGKALNVTATCCDVELTANGLVLTEVLFNASDTEEGGFILKPKEGTNVLVGSIGGDENSLYLVSMDEIESVQVKVEQELFTIDAEGLRAELTSGKITVKNQASDLKQILNAIVTMVKQLTVSTSTGPSGTPLPPTLASAQQIETNITNLFD